MTKIWVMSDLHDDVARPLIGNFSPPADVDADVLVVAGDIAGRLSTMGRSWLEAQRTRLGIPIVVVAGNHDYWRGSLDREIERFRERLQIDGIHVLDGDSIEIAGIRFVGGTLWTDYAVWHGDRYRGQREAMQYMNDFRYIKTGSGNVRPKARPSDIAEIHASHRAAIARTLAVPFDGPTVVVTHHAPSAQSLRDGRVTEPLDAAYASDLEDLIATGAPDLWIHGHIHSCHDYTIGRTRIIANPRGYVMAGPGRTRDFAIQHENPSFDERLVVELAPAPKPDPMARFRAMGDAVAARRARDPEASAGFRW